jgi:hypothetical protein
VQLEERVGTATSFPASPAGAPPFELDEHAIICEAPAPRTIAQAKRIRFMGTTSKKPDRTVF